MINIQLQKSLSKSLNLEISLQIASQSFLAVSGESGSGKTTLLRILAGLEEAQGVIDVSGDVWLSERKSLAPQKRHIGFLFQDYALFENMTVLENLLFVSPDKALAEELLTMTRLSDLKSRYPNTLSGGQKQRVALCRAMMRAPKILLLDEPLSALDPKMRTKLQHDILALHKRFKTTTIMVSHDPSEIYRLANRVVVLEEGKVIKDGLPKEVLLQTQGSQKFSLRGEILEILQADLIHIGVVSIGQQIVEVVMDAQEASSFQVGEQVYINTKAFSLSLSKVSD